jgi:two-component system chemotaxis response regulator CheY
MDLQRCLIVDDDEVGRNLVAENLPGVACTQATNGQEAVAGFVAAMDAGTPFQLVVLDIMMPGISGIEAGKAMRKAEKERQVPLPEQAKVIMLTARNTPQDVMDAMMSAQSGAYLVKPLEPAKLKEALSKLGLRLPK